MAEVKLNLTRLNPGALITEMKNHAALAAPAAPGTPPVPNMATAVTGLNAKITDAETANNAYEAARTSLGSLKTARDDAADALRSESGLFIKKAESESAGDAGMLQALGFQVAGATPSPAPSLGAPGNLSVTAGDHEGSVDVQCDPPAMPRSMIGSYKWQYTTADPINGPWTDAEGTKNSSTTISGLTSGSRIWVRGCAVTTHGTTAWTDPATKIVP